MRGMLRSKRCQRCRRRKIKCDENWPSCTQCVRAKSTCSGPPPKSRLAGQSISSTTFEDSHHFFPYTTDISAPSITTLYNGEPSPETIAHLSPEDYNFLSPESPPFRTEPTTTAERVAARLIGYLDKTSCFDASLAAPYLRLLPQRLGHSAALRDAVALFCSSWGNFRRRVPAEQLIDRRAYGKALRSLQRALDDPHQQLSCETLAATTMLDRVEVMFDVRREFGQVTHARGIRCLMAQRGPPCPDDELDITLTLGNQGTLLYSFLLEGGTNFFLTRRWRDALEKAVLEGNTKACPLLVDAWRLDTQSGCWPGAIHEAHTILQSDPKQDPERLKRAIDLRDRVEVFAETVDTLGDESRRTALRAGLIVQVPDPAAPPGCGRARYDFPGPVGGAGGSFETLQRWLMYVLVSLMLNSIMQSMCTVLREPEDGVLVRGLKAEQRALGREVWLCVPFMRALGPIAIIVFATPLLLSLEAGGHEERDYVLDAVLDMDKHRGRLPKDKTRLEDVLLICAQLVTGRARIDPKGLLKQA